MSPQETNLALAQEQIERARKDLWEVQLVQYPDSIPMSLKEAFDLSYELPPYLEGEMAHWEKSYAVLYPDPAYRRGAKSEKRASIVMQYQLRMARAVAMCIQDPCGFFYRCGKQKDGTYRWIGFRYGLDPAAYMSGFST